MAWSKLLAITLSLWASLAVTSSAASETVSTEADGVSTVSRILSNDPNPDPNCVRGFRNVNGRRLCCSPMCSTCGGKGCNKNGGRDFCCGGRIGASGRTCDTVGAPCFGTQAFPSPAPPPAAVGPDPFCGNGIYKRGICCPLGCGFCGGDKCRSRTPAGAPVAACCLRPWRSGSRNCRATSAPCLVHRQDRPGDKSTDRSVWQTITDELRGKPTPRHEACMAWVDGKGYLIGGRGQKPVDIFDPAAGTWTEGTGAGFVMNHMQCVGWGGKVWVVSAWTGGFPRESNVPEVWVYDTADDSWSTRDGLPEARRRGGGAAILYDDKVYVIGGNRGGHGGHAQTLGWMDYYDLVEDSWTTNLADLPSGRDHVTGARVTSGGEELLCVAGGRDGGSDEFFTATLGSTWCYNVRTRKWSDMRAAIPTQRGGATATRTCAGAMMIAGGERLAGRAIAEVDVFDGRAWATTTALNRGRHGGGLVTSDCGACGKIYAVSGSGGRGGGPELDSTEEYLSTGVDVTCASF